MKSKIPLSLALLFTACPLATAGLFSTPIDNPSFESPSVPNSFSTIVDLWAEETDAFVQSETSGNMILTPHGTQWGGLSGGDAARGAIYQQVGTFDGNVSYTVSFRVGDRPNKVFPGLQVQLWAGGTALGDTNDASSLNGSTLESQGAVLIDSYTTVVPPLSGSVEQSHVFDTGPATLDYTTGDALWVRFVAINSGDQQALIDNVAIAPFVPEAVLDVSSGPIPIKMFERSVKTISFTITNAGAGSDLFIENPVFDDPRFKLISPALPTSIVPGDSIEFVVEADMKVVSGAQTVQSTLSLTTNDSTSTTQNIDLEARILAGGRRVLIDYDDGIPGNGVHDESIRNGGFEDGVAGDDFATTPNWFARDVEGDAVQLTYDSDPASGLLRGTASGWQPGTNPRAQAAQLIELDEWTLEEGDQFTLKVTWKNGPGFVEGSGLQVIIQIANEFGAAVGDPANSEDPNTDRFLVRNFALTAADSYQTEIIASQPIQPGSPWIGQRPLLWILVGGSRDESVQIDNVSMVGNLYQEPIVLSDFSYDDNDKQVTLRWNDTGRVYKVQGTNDLNFGIGVSEIPLDGSEDRATYPGEIEFQFTDPAATGAKHFWRVATD